MLINDILSDARRRHASDVHITDEKNPVFRIHGNLTETDYTLSSAEKQELIYGMLSERQRKELDELRDADFCYTYGGVFRHRVNVYRNMGTLSAAIRIINNEIPSPDELGLPQVLRDMAFERRGLVLVTGPTGSGKSTTLASMIESINLKNSEHIITIEDPIEYLYENKKSTINQREVGFDVNSFGTALRSVLREDPDVIMVGEMRDYETMSAAITAAETGHLVFSTLHTVGAANTIDRIIDVFPSHSQQQIRTQLSCVLKGVITQQLIPRSTQEGRIAAFEILVGTDAVLNMIRDNKCFQLDSVMQTGAQHGMITMDDYLKRLVRNGDITQLAAHEKAIRKSEFNL